MQKSKMAIWGGLTIAMKRREMKRKQGKIGKEEGKIYPFECRVPKNSKER